MHYELVSRSLAYVSCISTMSLLMTSMAIAAINVGRAHSSFCTPSTCVPGIRVSEGKFQALTNKVHIEKLAARLWSAKV